MDRSISGGPGWARVSDDVRSRLRRGAWYPVLSLSPTSVVLDVNRLPLSLHRSYVELITQRPTYWSVVARDPSAAMIPESWGAWYAVCPGCASRAPIERVSGTMACAGCGQSFEIDWRGAMAAARSHPQPRPQPRAA